VQYSNSSFRTAAERSCIRGLSSVELIDLLVKVGVPAADAEEFADDPNAVPTSVRKLIVSYQSRR